MTLVDRVCLVALLAITGLVLEPHSARAQSAEAEVLFRDGRSLIKDGKIAVGCDKLDASAKLEPSVGTLLNVGDCREKLGQVASAWAAFRKAEALAKRTGHDDKRMAEAGKRAFKLEPQITNLTIEVKNRIDGLVVRRNDSAVDSATWNSALPVDPGTYTVVAEAPGYKPWRTTFQITSRTRRQAITVPELEREQVARAPEPQPPPPSPPLPRIVRPIITPFAVPVSVTPHRDDSMTTARKVSLAFGVVGVAALGTGVYFGVHSKDLQDQADQRCPLTVCSDALGLRLNENARASANGANVLYAAGGAAVVTAVVLWFVGKPGEQSTVVRPTITDRQVGVSIAGSF